MSALSLGLCWQRIPTSSFFPGVSDWDQPLLLAKRGSCGQTMQLFAGSLRQQLTGSLLGKQANGFCSSQSRTAMMQLWLRALGGMAGDGQDSTHFIFSAALVPSPSLGGCRGAQECSAERGSVPFLKSLCQESGVSYPQQQSLAAIVDRAEKSSPASVQGAEPVKVKIPCSVCQNLHVHIPNPMGITSTGTELICREAAGLFLDPGHRLRVNPTSAGQQFQHRVTPGSRRKAELSPRGGDNQTLMLVKFFELCSCRCNLLFNALVLQPFSCKLSSHFWGSHSVPSCLACILCSSDVALPTV